MICALAICITAATVVDGDTIRRPGPDYRLFGIDTPERGKPGFAAASEALQSLIDGKVLACDDIDTDRYGRKVVRCFLPDGRDLGCAMVATGTAVDWPRYSKGAYATCAP